ncbi:hypothetical protein LCGC14_1119820, partial [marine sediment metagenome]
MKAKYTGLWTTLESDDKIIIQE